MANAALERSAFGRRTWAVLGAIGRVVGGLSGPGQRRIDRLVAGRRWPRVVAVIVGGASLRLTGAEDAGRFLPNSTAGRDRGSATLWSVAGIAVLFALGIAVVWAGVGVNTRHRAVAAADLSALAAASNVGDGEDVACGKAQWVSTRMRVTMTSCRIEWPDALVEVSAVPPGVLESFGPAEARARAGPVERPVGPR